ncbi:DUF2479 domain-containing protein [Weissella muntiaci]|uniref:DUF2479 domain-containing protein n=1 Tax=Weissella muntiaci TaxID=2508881 RepID=A0A6C2C9Q6_9LACO|nr:BppU family phage baseplate upper protein [Weissella muntiaci]TYC50748.1 DUF2479 domain-containing protein [Weissella muntiaci]
MATAQTAGKFAIVNTLLNMTDVTLIEQLNGRQGDNGREVFFWLKKGDMPFDISNKDIKITVKDASGKIKEISTVKDVLNAQAGQFSMVIPAEMYQASGDIEEGYISVSDETGMMVSSIPIMFNVLGNNVIFTSNPSSDYIDAIEKLIQESKDKLTSFDLALSAQQSAYDALKLSLSAMAKEIEDKQVVTLNGDNVLTGNNVYLNPIEGSFKTREATFVSFDDVALDMTKYPGLWFIKDKTLTNAPFAGWYTVEVITGSSATTGTIVADYYAGGRKITAVSDGKIVGWRDIGFVSNWRPNMDVLAGQKITFRDMGDFGTGKLTNPTFIAKKDHNTGKSFPSSADASELWELANPESYEFTAESTVFYGLNARWYRHGNIVLLDIGGTFNKDGVNQISEMVPVGDKIPSSALYVANYLPGTTLTRQVAFTYFTFNDHSDWHAHIKLATNASDIYVSSWLGNSQMGTADNGDAVALNYYAEPASMTWNAGVPNI